MAVSLNLEVKLMSKNKQIQKSKWGEEINPDDFVWIPLGHFANGVRNDEGFSKRFMSLGSRRVSMGFKDYHMSHLSRKIHIVQISEKFYYTNSKKHHHVDVNFFEWSGNIKDYMWRI